MYLVQILLPLFDNRGDRFPREVLRTVKAELTEEFGGLTAYTRSPAEGLWKEDDDTRLTHDEIVIYEVMAESLDERWWRIYRETLETRFQQERIVIRAHPVDLL